MLTLIRMIITLFDQNLIANLIALIVGNILLKCLYNIVLGYGEIHLMTLQGHVSLASGY